MKKLVAILLTGCMTFQSLMGSVVPIQAASNAAQVTTVETSSQEEETTLQEAAAGETEVEDADAEENQSVISEENAGAETEITVEEMTKEASVQEENTGVKTKAKKEKKEQESIQSARGGLDVSINSGLLSKQNSPVEVEIEKSGESTQEHTVSWDTAGGIHGGVSFTDLEPGDWNVTVRAPKFAHYTQTVTVKAQQTSQILLNSELTAKGGPGVLYLGDVDNDGGVNEEDKNLMVDYLHNELPDARSMDSNYDLNGDGQVDLADLQHISQNMEKEPVTSKVESLIYSGGIDIEESATTTVTGDVQDILGNTGSMKLEPTGGAEISEKAPVEVAFTLPEDAPKMAGITIQAPVTSENGEITSDIKSGVVIVEDVDGKSHEFDLNDAPAKRVALFAARTQGVTVGADGSLNLNFGSQIAVKKVTIKITGTTKKEQPLVEISKVEFLNDMESKIPAPELNIPGELKAEVGNKTINLSWSEETNVTGYEIYAEGNVGKYSDFTFAKGTLSVASNSHEMTVITDETGVSKSLINKQEYTIKVRSVNGEWKSPWSEEIKAVPKPSGAPPKPDNVKAEGRYRAIDVNWKQMEDTDSYMVYYRERGQGEFEQVQKENLTRNTYTITGLEDGTVYEVKVKGYNDNGWGPDSAISNAETVTKPTTQLPKFRQINTPDDKGINKNHITDATTGTSGKMIESPLDSGNSAWGLVDNNYGSYWYKADWDDGVSYPEDFKGVKITFDQAYKMSYFTFAAMDVGNDFSAARVYYWDNQDGAYNEHKEVGVRLVKKMDENQNPYYLVKFDEVVEAAKIQLFLQAGPRNLRIGEMHFHEDDGLELEIMDLYADEEHVTLKSDVTDEKITELENKLEEVDETSKEKHPAYDELKLELKTIREIFEGRLAPAVEVNNQITGKKDGHLGFGGLNAWQPLGYTTYAGERLRVQVGHNTRKSGMSADLQLIVTQNHAESASFVQTYNLKVGKNELTVPALQSIDVEKGGQLYIAYTGNNPSDEYGVRIGGGTKIPVLNVYGKTGEDRSKAIETYVEELEVYVKAIEANHEKLHNAEGSHKNVKYDYDEHNCILNTTDIMMESMMYSVPATQIWEGLKEAQDKAAHLDRSLKVMEDMMTLFYQHKGLNDDGGAKNALPSQHLNIRYMRMFAGAFMYAGGNHIGVEFGQTIMSNKSGLESFGWGIAHEIGHNINQGTYAVAEVTNNYYAQLLTKRKRYEDSAVYDKVTSGAIGDAPSVFTQLAMYWQLHLAYDNNKEDHTIYDDYQEQFDNLFFARMDTYARNPGAAPKTKGLDFADGRDQSLMRLACAAANANILPFFERWGKVPNQKTRDYAAQYGDPTEKALYYVNEEARDYRVDHKDAAGIKGQDVATAKVSAKSNRVEVEIQEKAGIDRDLILGYEIVRSMTSNGRSQAQVIGFIPVDQKEDTTVFIDTVSSINNRVMDYQVRPVDKLLNYGASASAGSVKIETEGRLSKTGWTVETNMVSEDDKVITPDEDDPDSGYNENGTVEPNKVRSIERVIDDLDSTVYNGKSEGPAEIIVDMHKTETVAALQYKGDLFDSVTVEISSDGQEWETVKKDYKNLKETAKDGAYKIWFNNENTNTVKTYKARYVKLIIPKGGEISIQEIEICGPSGDNMEFYKADGKLAVGVLKNDFVLDEKSGAKIPKGSLIFTGTYKGNPAYNVALLYDEEGNVVGAHEGDDGEITVEGYSVLFAEDPKDGDLGETSEGIWVYYLEPGKWEENLPKKVRGELYRVNNAETNEGERIVSDTTLIEVPDKDDLPEITLEADDKPATRQK